MGLPSKTASASNICLKDKNEMEFNDTKVCSISKASSPFLSKTWYLNYLFHQMSLMKLKLQATIITLSLRT